MYQHKINRIGKGTVEITIELPKSLIEIEYETSFSKLLLDLELPGFRKGKVPRNLAEKYLKKEIVFEELVKTLIPKIYQEIVKKEELKPVISPKIELLNAKENQDWKIKISLAEKPTVILGNYKELIQKAKADIKKEDIWIPGKKEPSKEPTDKEKSEKQQKLLNAVLSALLKEVNCEISNLIIEEELNHRLSNLLTDIQKIGLSVESYLKSKNLTQEQLKKRYQDEIEQTYKLEFILSELADKEKVTVGEQELDKLFSSITDVKEKESAKANSYFYASVLRKQKTLDRLLNI